MTAVRAALAVARRELGAYGHSAVAYVVGVLFLAIQGLSFWAVVQVVSDPRRPAPYGAVLHNHFGGTVLSWAVLFAVVSALAMRLVAEEKRQGTWETLLTAPASEGAVLTGKWLGAVTFATLLWVPTLAYVGVLWAHLPPGGSFDPGPVASAYLGVVLAQASFLAIGLAASAVTGSQIIAAVTTFVLLFVLLVVGQVPELAPAWFEGRPGWREVFATLDVRAHMGAFARGAIRSPALAVFGSLIATGLAVAGALAVLGRRRRAEVARRFASAGLVVALAILATILAARHPTTWDVTASGTNTLHPRARGVLEGLDRKVSVIVVHPLSDAFDPVYDQVDRVLARMRRAQPLLERRDLDPARAPERAEALAAEFAIAPRDLAEGGAVIFEVGGRRRAVELLDMAGFAYDDLGVGEISELRAEEAFATALLDLSAEDHPLVCYTTSHGEMPLAAREGGEHWGAVADRLTSDAMELRDVGDVAGGVPEDCGVLVVAGPRTPLPAAEADAVDRFLGGGGRALVAARGRVTGGGVKLPRTGLELPLGELGIRLPRAIVVDPERALDVPGSWAVVDGYGEHPASAAFQGRQMTVWRLPRAVTFAPADGVRGGALVRSSGAGWGETDLASATGQPAYTDEDVQGPVPVAVAAESVAGGGRAVVFGSAEALSSEVVGSGAVGNHALAASATSWLAGRTRTVPVGPKTPEHVRLVMTAAERRGVFALCVLGLPLAFLFAGGTLWWWRRREPR